MTNYAAKLSICFFFFLPFHVLFSQEIVESPSNLLNPKEEGKTKLDFTGYARGLAYGGSEDYDFSNVFAELALKARLSKQNTFLFADLRIREGLFFNQRELHLQLKEAYAGYRGDKIRVYLGNQIVAWGRTDGFNPTNNITPNDYFFLTGEPDDQKLSNFMLRTRFRISNTGELDIIAIPVFKPSIYRYELFKFHHPVNYLEPAYPPVKFRNSTLAARLNFELPGLGFSLSYFNGYDPFYAFTLEDFTLAPLLLEYRPKAYHKQTIGADFAFPIRSLMFRGELAGNITEGYTTGMHIPNPDLSYVLGLEKRILNTTALFQYIGKYTFDFTELQQPVLAGPTPEDLHRYAGERLIFETALYNRKIFSQQEETNHAIMLSLSRTFFYEELQVELTGLYNITSEEWLTNGRIHWSMTDALSAGLGAIFMSGPDKSVFDLAGRVMNGLFCSLSVKF